MSPIVVLVVVAATAFGSLALSYTKVPKGCAYVIERNGSFHCVWECGLHFKVPFIDVTVKKVSLEQQAMSLKPLTLVMKDGVGLQIESAVFYNVTDAQKYTYNINNADKAVEKLSFETLKTYAGCFDSQELISSADSISSKLTDVLSQAAEIWGIDVQRFVINEIIK